MLTLTDVRVLTVREPWVSAMTLTAQQLEAVRGYRFDGPREPLTAKRTENRRQKTNYRGPILLHTSLTVDRSAFDEHPVLRALVKAGLLDRDRLLPLGRVVASAEIVGCHASVYCCGPWGEQGLRVWHWGLDRVEMLTEPVACRGALGLWRPPAEVLERVTAQLGAGAR